MAPSSHDSELRAQIEDAAQRGYPYYVYTLSDSQGVFYVGKGKRLRVFHHGKSHDDPNRRKALRLALGPATRRCIAFFACEKLALAVEAERIVADRDTLTNISAGNPVDPRDSHMAHAQTMLARIIPVEEWTPPDWLRLPLAQAREVYARLVEEIRREATDPTPIEYWFDSQNRVTTRIWSA